ncbi:UNVERIFIED_CONTAM: cytochrome c oxidase subunit II [Euhalothece sp. KZN 001]|jgi:cytochrome c oxidase, subunit II
MQHPRLGSLLIGALIAAVALVDPVAAQASATVELIDELNLKLLYVAIPITLLVEGILIYAVFRFRDNDEPQPTEENRRLEITWTVATAIILVFVGVASYGVLADEAVTYTPDAEVEGEVVVVEAEAYQWGWEMTYPEEGQITTDGEVVIPADRPVRFDITSRDVIHGFAVPELGLKQDAFPQQVNSLQTTAYEEGTYQGYCTEYCGVAHSQMYFTVEVVSEEEYDAWLADQQAQ